jgi:uncharacterized integral membrane protein (TIGR00698 family)
MNIKLKGILVSVLVGGTALIVAPFIPMVNAIVLALILGILLSNIFTLPLTWNPGISFSSKHILETAIIFLGFGISFQDISNLGWQMAAILMATITIILIATFYLSKIFTCRTSTGYLVGFGTAICGSSAIAAIAPKISTNKKDAGIAIAVVNLLGLVGMVTYPLLFSEEVLLDKAALFIGGSLHGVSNVAGAGYAMDEQIGDLAITIKLGRVALLAPAMIFFNFIINRKASIIDNLKLPFYIVGFVIATSMVSFFDLPGELISALRWIGKALLTVAMAAIGLKIHLNHLYEEGKAALGFGVVIYILMILIITGMSYFL